MKGVFVLSFFLFLGFSQIHGGFLSKLLKPAGKEAFEHVTKDSIKKAAREALESATKKNIRKLSKEFPEAANGMPMGKFVDDLSVKLGKNPEEVAAAILKNKGVAKRFLDNGNTDAIAMAVRNGDAGWFLMRRFPENFTKGSKWLGTNADDAIQESWKLVDPASATGSWSRLRKALTRGNMNNNERDFAEKLFKDRVESGRVFGFSKEAKYFDGHLGDKRQGLDFISVRKGEKPSIIEFSTGSKPSKVNPLQMTDDRVKEQWLEIIGDPDMRINLRSAGISPELLNPKFVGSPDFLVSRYFDKVIAAPQIDFKAASEIGCRSVVLP